MGCLGFIIGVIFPRLFSIYAYFFTDWFYGVFQSTIWPVAGFLFLPHTVLWYSVVINWFHGHWSLGTVIGMVVAVIIDLGTYGVYANRD